MGLEGKHPSLFHLGDIEEAGTTEAAAERPADIRRSNHQHPDHDTEGDARRDRLLGHAASATNHQHPDHDTDHWSPRPGTA